MKEKVLKLLTQESISLERLLRITSIPQPELEQTIKELLNEKLIFLNTSKKYEIMKEEYSIGILEKTSKGSAYAVVNGQKIYIAPNELHTALKNDLVVVEER